jgi:hypothetical protein
MQMRGVILMSFVCAVLMYAAFLGMHDKPRKIASQTPATGSLSGHGGTRPWPHQQLCQRKLGECASRSASRADISETTLSADDDSDEKAAPVDRFRILVLRGTLRDREGKPLSGDIGMLFTIYSRETGGVPMWQESQIVQANERGRFKALIGSMTQEGVPQEVPEAESNLWVDQQVLLPGAATLPRLPLTRTEDGLAAEPIDEPFLLPEQSGISKVPPEPELPAGAVAFQRDDIMTGDRSRRAHVGLIARRR